MKNEKHLTLEDCLKLYLLPEDRGEFQQQHLDRCPDCLVMFQKAQRELRDQAAQFRRQVDEVPDNFWANQRHQIVWRVRATEAKGSLWRLFDLKVWATVASVFILSIVLIEWTPRQRLIPQEVAQVQIKDERDERLLREVYQAIHEDQADPLQPLDLLVKVPDSFGQNAEKEHYHGTS